MNKKGGLLTIVVGFFIFAFASILIFQFWGENARLNEETLSSNITALQGIFNSTYANTSSYVSSIRTDVEGAEGGTGVTGAEVSIAGILKMIKGGFVFVGATPSLIVEAGNQLGVDSVYINIIIGIILVIIVFAIAYAIIRYNAG